MRTELPPTEVADFPRAVLFDLDGTLVDTAREIVAAVNRAVAPLTAGRSLPYDLVRSWIGNGTIVLFRRALRHCGIDDAALDAEFEVRWPGFQQAYADTCGTCSEPYPGALACLRQLRQSGRRLGIVTNKEATFTERLLRAHGLREWFEVVVSGDTLPQRKPAPQPVQFALAALGVERTQGLFIGDSMVDLRTGAAAGVRTWALTHGYHNGSFARPLPAALQPERFVTDFHQLCSLLA